MSIESHDPSLYGANKRAEYLDTLADIDERRYGIQDFELALRMIETPAGPICKIPMSVPQVGNLRLPVTGGAYFRLFPYFGIGGRLTAGLRSTFGACNTKVVPTAKYLLLFIVLIYESFVS